MVKLPFGTLYPSPGNAQTYFDFQIEGIGTKTLLAELSGNYSSIGIDAVAMAVNDVIRSGARPVLLTDAIHISNSDPRKVRQLVSGVRAGAKTAGSLLVSGETGDVAEILHQSIEVDSPPFDLFVSCLGLAKEDQIIDGDVSPGDRIIGLRSSGIHSNGLTLARKVLLKKWGGKFDSWDIPGKLQRSVIEELLLPTMIYSSGLERLREDVKIKAAIHITGDGFSKFRRLSSWKRLQGGSRIGFTFKLDEKIPEIFRLIHRTAKLIGLPLSLKEMYKTFNMGYGFAVIVAKDDRSRTLDSLNNEFVADDIGFVSPDEKISLISNDMEKPIFL
ncbi:MAG: AIR synthase-related protein [Thaumarchaeota archaeon]|nr:AIR synthase-related protein [Nitrososphaerota archaeon]